MDKFSRHYDRDQNAPWGPTSILSPCIYFCSAQAGCTCTLKWQLAGRNVPRPYMYHEKKNVFGAAHSRLQCSACPMLTSLSRQIEVCLTMVMHLSSFISKTFKFNGRRLRPACPCQQTQKLTRHIRRLPKTKKKKTRCPMLHLSLSAHIAPTHSPLTKIAHAYAHRMNRSLGAPILS